MHINHLTIYKYPICNFSRVLVPILIVRECNCKVMGTISLTSQANACCQEQTWEKKNLQFQKNNFYINPTKFQEGGVSQKPKFLKKLVWSHPERVRVGGVQSKKKWGLRIFSETSLWAYWEPFPSWRAIECFHSNHNYSKYFLLFCTSKMAIVKTLDRSKSWLKSKYSPGMMTSGKPSLRAMHVCFVTRSGCSSRN